MGVADPAPMILAAFLGAVGVGAGANARFQLPRWARERATQMDGLAERIPLLLADADGDGDE